MTNPTGYTALDLVGYTDKGDYSSSETYVKNDLANYNGIKWRCLIDDTTDVTPTEGLNWTKYIEYGDYVKEVDYKEDIYGVNLLDVKATSDTRSGITYTVNSNKTITLNGTSTNGYGFVLGSLYASNLKNGETYRLSDGGAGDYDPSGYTSFTYINGVKPDGTKTNNICITPTITTFTVDFNTYVAYEVGIYVRAGKTISNLVYYPMIYKSSLGTNLPFVGFNEQSIQNQITDQTNVLGAKNWLNNNEASQVINGITWTVNADKTVTANGTVTSGVLNSQFSIPFTFGGRSFLFNGSPNDNNCQSYIWDTTTSARAKKSNGDECDNSTNNSDSEVFPVEGHANKFVLRVVGTVSNVVFKPMLRLASDPDNTYMPHAMTNTELTEKKINLSDLKTVVSSSSDFAAFKTAIANL